MKTNPYYPHRERRSNIKYSFLLIALAAVLAAWLAGCTQQKHGCNAVRGMSGYSYIRCKETGTICYFNKEGKLVHICKKSF